MNKQNLNDEDIVVTNQSMVSALGIDPITACAAARAGVTRAGQLVLQLDSSKNERFEPIVGHAADLIAHGFDGQGRLLRLVSIALRELNKQKTIESGTNLYLAASNPQRAFQSLSLIGNEEERERVESNLDEKDKKPLNFETMKNFLGFACAHADLENLIKLDAVFDSGHTALPEALQAAITDLQIGKIKTAIVGSVDSYVTTKALQWLKSTGRLKTEKNPVGLQPGEASCFFVLEKLGLARNRGCKRFFGIIDRVEISQASHSFIEGTPPYSKTLAETILNASTSIINSGETPWFIPDLNGEVYRALEWAQTLNFFKGNAPQSWSEAPMIIPAMSFGETGSVSAGVGMQMAFHMFWRRTAPSQFGIICSCSDGRLRSAITLREFSGKKEE